MKNLIIVFVMLSSIVNAQSDGIVVITVDQEMIETLQIKHVEDTVYQVINEVNHDHEYASVCPYCDLAEIYTNSAYTYDIIINGHHLTFKADLLDDVLTDVREVTIDCDCNYDVEENILLIRF